MKLPPQIVVVMVNESGASIYSASEVAREEFPDYDVTKKNELYNNFKQKQGCLSIPVNQWCFDFN